MSERRRWGTAPTRGGISCADCGNCDRFSAVERSEFYYDQGVPEKLLTGVSGQVIPRRMRRLR